LLLSKAPLTGGGFMPSGGLAGYKSLLFHFELNKDNNAPVTTPIKVKKIRPMPETGFRLLFIQAQKYPMAKDNIPPINSSDSFLNFND
jgi:hypothetical protein